jgi:hypothetical protein
MKAKDFRWGVDKLSEIELEPSSHYSPDYDPYMQLIGLNQLVDTLLQKSLANSTDIQVGKHTGAYSGDRGGDNYADDCGFLACFDAFMSSSVAAALALFLEGFIKNEVLSIKNNKGDSAKDPNHVRTIKLTKTKDFWCVSSYWCEKENKKKAAFIAGTIQLFEALDLRPKLPANFDAFITVLFQYRNNVMHNGVEWEKSYRDKFKEIISKTECEGFEWSTSAGKDNICYLKDEYVKELLVFCNDLYQVFYPN